MKRRILTLAIAAATAATPFAATMSHAGANEILPAHGQKICQGSQCLRVDADTGRMQLFGRNSTAIPAGIDVSDGQVTHAEFQQMLRAAGLASAYGSGRR